jgi:hypothetical protein
LEAPTGILTRFWTQAARQWFNFYNRRTPHGGLRIETAKKL